MYNLISGLFTLTACWLTKTAHSSASAAYWAALVRAVELRRLKFTNHRPATVDHRRMRFLRDLVGIPGRNPGTAGNSLQPSSEVAANMQKRPPAYFAEGQI